MLESYKEVADSVSLITDWTAIQMFEESELVRYSCANAAKAINELRKQIAAYEDAEEQGLLVRLPCKVGDTVYAPTRSFVSEFRVSQFDFAGYEKSSLWVEWHLTKGITGNFRLDGIRASEIGKTVFLTREEAEAALKGETKDVG